MAPPVPIPPDVSTWLLGVFGDCNRRVSTIVTNVPTTHETPLDMSFIQSFLDVSAPHRFDSGWTVQISTHYLGGGRHWAEFDDWPRKWEIADIGLLVLFRQGGKLLRSKIALLQSKRLYADELDLDEDNPLDYMIGFGRLYQPDDEWRDVLEPRQFTFTEASRYQALMIGTHQYNAIRGYEEQRQIPVYYMLYNPLCVPSTTALPLVPGNRKEGDACIVGCRVVPARDLRQVLDGRADGGSPTYGDLTSSIASGFDAAPSNAGWRLEDFVVKLLLECETGYIAAGSNDSGLNYVFNRRTGPISAALAVTLDAP